MNSYKPGVNVAFYLFGKIPIPWYGIIVVFSFLIAFLLVWIEWNKKGKSKWDLFNITSAGIVFVLWGSRFWYVIFDPVNSFSDVHSFLDFLLVFFNIGTGRSILGSIFFLSLWLFIYEKKINPELKFFETIDIFLPAMLLSQAIGRWGNFSNHQVFGQIVDGNSLNWLAPFIKENMYINFNGVEAYRQPLFLYESFATLFSWLIIISLKIINFKKINNGTYGALFFIFYGIIRSSMEPFRDPAYQMHWGTFLTSFWSSILLIVIGMSLLIYLNRNIIYNFKYK